MSDPPDDQGAERTKEKYDLGAQGATEGESAFANPAPPQLSHDARVVITKLIPVRLASAAYYDPTLERLPDWLDHFADSIERHDRNADLYMQEVSGLRAWSQIIRELLRVGSVSVSAGEASPLTGQERSAQDKALELAAPDLYEALVAILLSPNSGALESADVTRAHAALAKADQKAGG